MAGADDGELTLRPAVEGDLPSVAAVYLAARGAAERAGTMPPGVHGAEEIQTWVRGWDLAHSPVWVAETRGEVVGYARVTRTWLDDLYVVPAAQGHGIGSALLDLVVSLLPNGFGLWVFVANAPARRFYAARGLVEVEHSDGSGNEEGAPDVQMRWPGR